MLNFSRILTLSFLLIIALPAPGLGQTPSGSQTPPLNSSLDLPNPQKTSSQALTRKKTGRRPSEKEAEGTQATNRFESNAIGIRKSKYTKPDGEPLEVDPD